MIFISYSHLFNFKKMFLYKKTENYFFFPSNTARQKVQPLYRVNTSIDRDCRQLPSSQPPAWPSSCPSANIEAGQMGALSQHRATRQENADSLQLPPLLSCAVPYRQNSNSCVLVRPKNFLLKELTKKLKYIHVTFRVSFCLLVLIS